MLYVLQDGMNVCVSYGVANYPSSPNRTTAGCRNITGRDNGDGTVTVYAVTSTISANGDTGADPNKLVKVTDLVSANSLPATGGNQDRGVGQFVTIRSPNAGEVFWGVASAPNN